MGEEGENRACKWEEGGMKAGERFSSLSGLVPIFLFSSPQCPARFPSHHTHRHTHNTHTHTLQTQLFRSYHHPSEPTDPTSVIPLLQGEKTVSLSCVLCRLLSKQKVFYLSAFTQTEHTPIVDVVPLENVPNTMN